MRAAGVTGVLRFVRPRRGHQPDVEALSASLDGRLPAAEAERLRAHVAGCAACRAQLTSLQSARDALRGLGEVEAPRSFALRQADLAAMPAPRRWAPALASATAVLVLAIAGGAVWYASRSGDGDSQLAASEAAPTRPVGAIAADSAAPSPTPRIENGPPAFGSVYRTPAASSVVTTPPSGAGADARADDAPLPRAPATGSATPEAGAFLNAGQMTATPHQGGQNAYSAAEIATAKAQVGLSGLPPGASTTGSADATITARLEQNREAARHDDSGAPWTAIGVGLALVAVLVAVMAAALIRRRNA